MEHGAPTDTIRQIGDFGNITADSSRVAHVEFTDTLISLNGKYSIIGRGIIIHKHADDFTTQPTGNAGPRIACGVIGIARTESSSN